MHKKQKANGINKAKVILKSAESDRVETQAVHIKEQLG